MKVGLPQQNTAQYSQKQMDVLQSQITQLSQKQKELLQAQITQKQRQVLQAIPYNQLSEKQKEILKRLSASKPGSSSATLPIVATPVLIRPNPGQIQTAVTLQPKDSQIGQAIKKGRRKNVYNKIPELKNGQIVRLPNSAIITKAPPPTKPIDSEPVIKEFVFSDEPIAAEDNIEIDGDPITMVAPTEFVATEVELAVNSIAQNPLEVSIGPETILSSTAETAAKNVSKIGSLKIKGIANAFQEISNIVAPTATPKETCPHCKKIFSKAGILQHIETKHMSKCDHCDLKFLQEELLVHVQNVHMAPCTICKEIFVKDLLEKHVEAVHKQECTKCKVKYFKTEINDHIRTIHEPEGCDDCESRFETKDLLKMHVDTVHLIEKCEECTSGFKTTEQLDTHVEEVHPKEYCDEDDCDAVFGTVALLDAHKEKIHPNPNKFVSFNGGMFMMMMVQDDKDEEEEKDDSDVEEVDNSEDLLKEAEAEKAAVYEFLEQLLLETADNIVKTAMTGQILFAVRFNEEEENVEENEEQSVEPEDERSEEAIVEESEEATVEESEEIDNTEDHLEEPSSSSDTDHDPLDDVASNDCTDNLMEE